MCNLIAYSSIYKIIYRSPYCKSGSSYLSMKFWRHSQYQLATIWFYRFYSPFLTAFKIIIYSTLKIVCNLLYRCPFVWYKCSILVPYQKGTCLHRCILQNPYNLYTSMFPYYINFNSFNVSTNCFTTYDFNSPDGCGLRSIIDLSPLTNSTLEPEVFPLLLSSKPKYSSNVFASS